MRERVSEVETEQGVMWCGARPVYVGAGASAQIQRKARRLKTRVCQPGVARYPYRRGKA